MNPPEGRARSDTGPRDRIVRGAAQLIRTQGVSGTGMREVVTYADAPRGSLQHYFPGGKDQLVGEALLWSGETAGRRVRRLMDGMVAPTPGGLLAGIVGWWRDQFLERGFDAGCPLVAAAADVAAANQELRGIIGRALDEWQGPVVDALEETGVSPDRAADLGVLILSALEGAIVLSRIRRDVAPLDIITAELTPILDAARPDDDDRG